MRVTCERIEPNNEIDKLLIDTFTNLLRPGYVTVGEQKICMPLIYETIADLVDNFQVRDTDIFIATHPKTGTTWTQEMVWMIVNDMDKDEGKKFIVERSPFLELQCIFDYREALTKNPNAVIPISLRNSIKITENCQSNPRIIKTHLPWSLLPKQIRERTKTPKIIHVIRTPKDTCVSYYHHCRLMEGFQGDFNDFYKLFLAGKLAFGPFWENVLGYWEKRSDPNILIIRFEDMKKDLTSVIRRVAEFLEKDFAEENIPALLEHLSFENMKKKLTVQVNGLNKMNEQFIQNTPEEFMRSGTVGGYTTKMTPHIIETFDKWTEEYTRSTDLTFES